MNVPVTLKEVNLPFNPIAYEGLQFDEPCQITLKCENRFVQVNNATMIISFYAELKDGGNNVYVVEVPYWLYCALSIPQSVVCDLYTLKGVGREYYYFEIAELDRPNLQTTDGVVEKPLAEDNRTLSGIYLRKYFKQGGISRVMNCYRSNIVSPYVSTNALTGVNIRVPVALKDFTSGLPITITHRELLVGDNTYKVDIMGEVNI